MKINNVVLVFLLNINFVVFSANVVTDVVQISKPLLAGLTNELGDSVKNIVVHALDLGCKQQHEKLSSANKNLVIALPGTLKDGYKKLQEYLPGVPKDVPVVSGGLNILKNALTDPGLLATTVVQPSLTLPVLIYNVLAKAIKKFTEKSIDFQEPIKGGLHASCNIFLFNKKVKEDVRADDDPIALVRTTVNVVSIFSNLALKALIFSTFYYRVYGPVTSKISWMKSFDSWLGDTLANLRPSFLKNLNASIAQSTK